MSRGNPLVSVIMPFYNTPQQFLREAVQSVLEQTYDNWELLLVDDGDRAGNAEVLQIYADQRPGQVRIISHSDGKNHGISASRQQGVENACGEYIAFLDADDLWELNKLEEQVAIMKSHPQAAMLYGNTLYWYSWSSESSNQKQDFQPAIGRKIEGLIEPPRLLPMYLEGKTFVPCTCSLLVRREIIDQTGGFEEAFVGMYEDQVFYAKVSLAAPIFVSSRCWDRYRQHPRSITADSTRAGMMTGTRLAFLTWLETYLSENELTDRQVWAALRRQLWILQGSPPAGTDQLMGRILKRFKKWRIKLEDWLLPAFIRLWIWAPSSKSNGLFYRR